MNLMDEVCINICNEFVYTSKDTQNNVGMNYC